LNIPQILGFVSSLLSIVALVNLQEVFGQLKNDQFEERFTNTGSNALLLNDHDVDDDSSLDDDQTQSGINEFARKSTSQYQSGSPPLGI
jgi:hypothetical protein